MLFQILPDWLRFGPIYICLLRSKSVFELHVMSRSDTKDQLLYVTDL